MTEPAWPTCPCCGSDEVWTESAPIAYCDCGAEWVDSLTEDGKREPGWEPVEISPPGQPPLEFPARENRTPLQLDLDVRDLRAL